MSLAPLSACRVLEQLQLGECHNLASLDPLMACTSLKRLSLNHCTKIIDLAPLVACTSIQQLDLYGSSSMDLAPLRYCYRLEKLALDAGPLHTAALRSFAHLKGLSIMNHRGGLWY